MKGYVYIYIYDINSTSDKQKAKMIENWTTYIQPLVLRFKDVFFGVVEKV